MHSIYVCTKCVIYRSIAIDVLCTRYRYYVIINHLRITYHVHIRVQYARVRQAAEGLARDAYARAIALCVAGSDKGPHVLPEKNVIGVGCTAAVATSRPKRGSHRCFVCTKTNDGVTHYRLDLAKGQRDRRVLKRGANETSEEKKGY